MALKLCFLRRSNPNQRKTWLDSLAATISIAVLLKFGGYALCGENTLPEREAFITTMSALLLGSKNPLPVGDGLGWRGVVLAENGATLPNLRRLYDQAMRNGASRPNWTTRAQVLSSIRAFDKPLSVNDGVGKSLNEPISRLWVELLRDATSKKRGDDGPKYDSIVGTAHEAKYDEYSAKFAALTRSELRRHSGEWRLDPRLSSFGSLREGKRSLLDEWQLFGSRDIVESWQALEVSRHFDPSIEARLEMNLAAEGEDFSPLYETYLFPSPEQWEEFPNWLSLRIKEPFGDGVVTFQVARVQMYRPWFHIDSVLTGEIRPKAVNNDQRYSDGKAPTALKYPSGRMSVFIEEILLVRRIQFDSRSSFKAHPLRKQFAYPMPMNMLGYVVRALPELQTSKD